MNKYIVQIPIKSAEGHQAFAVEANSENEAIEKVKSGEGEYSPEWSEVEVTDVDYNDVTVFGLGV